MASSTQSVELLLRQREALLGFVEAITAELELRPLLMRIVQSACELIGADRGTIGLVDEARSLVRTEAIYHMPDAELGREMPLGVGLAGAVLRTGRPLVLARYGDIESPVHPEHHDDAVIGVPIMCDDRMIGFFGIGNSPDARGPARGFEDADVEALQLFARHAGIAIVNARRFEEGIRRSERFELIARIGRLITAAPCVDDLLQNATDAIHEVLGYPNVAIGLCDGSDPDHLIMRAVSGASAALLASVGAGAVPLPEGVIVRAVDASDDPLAPREFVVPLGVGLLGAAAVERRLVVANDVARDPRYVRLPGLEHMQADMAVPLLLGDELLGVLNVESPQPFTTEDQVGMQIVADQIAIAMENTRLYEQSTRLAAHQERTRIARDLHDSVTQQLFGLTMIAESITPAFRRDAREGERRAQRVLELSRAALAEMRALLAELRPGDGEEPDTVNAGPALVRRRGLAAALQEYARHASLLGTRIELDTSGYRPLPIGTETALYRFTQEALHNALKHAHADHILVRLERGPHQVRVLLQDDGIGFAADGAGDGAQMGLRHMSERIEALGGVLRIQSMQGAGTIVEAIVPQPQAMT